MYVSNIRKFMNIVEGKDSPVDLIDLSNDLTKKIEGDANSNFIVKSKTKVNNPEFGGADTEEFSVDYVDSKNPESLQNTYKKLDAIIDPVFRDFRNKGWIFTQPQSVNVQTLYTGDKAGTLVFTIGKPKE